MTRRSLQAVSCGLIAALVLPAGSLTAQAPGLPLAGTTMPGGLHVAGTVGLSGDNAWPGEGMTYGATVGLASHRAGISATLARFNPDLAGVASRTGLGVLGTLRVAGGSLDVPLQVDFFGGYGWFDRPDACLDSCPSLPDDGRSAWRVPVGLGFTLSIATPVVSVRPWLAPRLEVREDRRGGDVITRDAHLAGSAGVDLRFIGGLGLRAAWDQVKDADRTIGFGLTYRF